MFFVSASRNQTSIPCCTCWTLWIERQDRCHPSCEYHGDNQTKGVIPLLQGKHPALTHAQSQTIGRDHSGHKRGHGRVQGKDGAASLPRRDPLEGKDCAPGCRPNAPENGKTKIQIPEENPVAPRFPGGWEGSMAHPPQQLKHSQATGDQPNQEGRGSLA